MIKAETFAQVMNDDDPFTRDVLAAIGKYALAEMQGQPERVKALFDSLVPQFNGHYPQHKILTHLCQDASEPKDITPEA